MSHAQETVVESGRDLEFASLLEQPTWIEPSTIEGEIIVAIDGPAGTGKSSVSRLLAKRLGLSFLDTGAMYRAAAAVAIDLSLDTNDRSVLMREVEDANIHFDWTRDPPEIMAHGRSLSHRIREKDVTSLVSPLAAIRELREHMVRLQREIASAYPRLVTEGRDQGSVVFPDASFKIYLTASAPVRARRRADQLRASGLAPDEAQLLREIIERDESDMSRADGPLRRPQGSIVLDTSSLTRDQVVDALESIVRGKSAGFGPDGTA